VKNIFIDGYNVVNSWKELRQENTGSMENSRLKLKDILLNYGVYNEYKIFLVFDAHLQSGSMEKREKINKNLTIVFTKEGETADSFIERYVNNIGRKCEVLVVTSDSLEQQLIFQRGAVRMSSIEFYHEIKSIEDKIRKESIKKQDEKRYNLKERIDRKVADKLEEIRRSK
jgi:predicted RNA-binding protein with PIN domain